jgi:hypothetical protein
VSKFAIIVLVTFASLSSALAEQPAASETSGPARRVTRSHLTAT